MRKEKVIRRKLERRYRKTNLLLDREAFHTQQNRYNALCDAAHSSWLATTIAESDSKDLFKGADKILGRTTPAKLPTCESDAILAGKFNNFFMQKIKSIRDGLQAGNVVDLPAHLSTVPQFFGRPLSNLGSFTQDQVKSLLKNSPTKSCPLDPIPTWLLKICMDQLLAVVTEVINCSLACGTFPSKLKQALVIPLLKKADLDHEELKNYRPVSNLEFLSKTVERAYCSILVEHLGLNGLLGKFQSAYRKSHSTETALTRVINDILRAVDKDGGAILILLDLSAAFDTIDHDKLLHLLETSFGVTGLALLWVKSYLTERSQTVKIGEAISEVLNLLFGVPQGSVLGPVLFIIYTTPLGSIISHHELDHHLYADDTQLYLAFKPKSDVSIEQAVSRAEACVEDIRLWMQANLLKLNDDKTELIVISPKLTSFAKPVSVSIGGHEILPDREDIDPPRNLGVLCDSQLSFEHHVNKVCKAVNYNLYSIGKIRKLISQSDTEKLVNALATSSLDYCNSVLFGSTSKVIDRLQRSQNHAARIITGTRKYDHVTPALKKLHWLPVRQRINFKILMLTFKALNGLAPTYLKDIISPYVNKRGNLRSETRHLLELPKVKARFGERSFSFAAPRLWNPLPPVIKNSASVDIFKRSLKTFLFDKPDYPPPILK